MFIGFVLLFSPCGHDACEWVPFTERIYQTEAQCLRVERELEKRKPQQVFSCDRVFRGEGQ
ncbi:hypothetical protein DO659_03140 [Salmonella enterica subsp. enterica serovar Minnesota]|nr:hypothetical protein [Salmonella enterica subsp. enterica serovar Minnesota]